MDLAAILIFIADVNECLLSPCGAGDCENTDGSYVCQCDTGYVSTETTCQGG